MTLQTRSGDVPQPDASWSAWSPAYTHARGEDITSPPARYLQYRAVLTRDAGAAPGAAPKLRGVTVYYLTRNQPPTVHVVSPTDGAALHKAALLQWSASDPDNDTLAYDLSYSPDGGKTWTPIKKKAAPQGPNAIPQAAPTTAATTTTPGPVTEQEVTAKATQMIAALDRQHPGLSPTVRAKMIAQATDVIRSSLQAQHAAPPPAPAGTSTNGSGVKDTSFSWDTTEVPDGTYQLRVIASDKPSNPADALTAQAISSPFPGRQHAPHPDAGRVHPQPRQDGDHSRRRPDHDGLRPGRPGPRWTPATSSPPWPTTACSTPRANPSP